MKNEIVLFIPYMQAGFIVPCEDIKIMIGVIMPYMQPVVIVPCEDMKVE